MICISNPGNPPNIVALHLSCDTTYCAAVCFKVPEDLHIWSAGHHTNELHRDTLKLLLAPCTL